MTVGIQSSPLDVPVTPETVLDTIALAAALLFENGQTTEQTVVAAERLGSALGVRARVLPSWGNLLVEIEGAPLLRIVQATPLGVNMRKVAAVMKLIDQVCDGKLPFAATYPALVSVSRLSAASTLRFVLFAAIGAASLGVIFGALDVVSLLLIAASAGAGALIRRWLARLSDNPFVQPLCAALAAGIAAAAADRLQLSHAQSLIALSPCMVLVPGPHLLNGAIDLVRARIALGIARLAYAGVTILMICAGLLAGLAAGGATLQAAGSSVSVPLAADVVAAGCAVAAFGTFFSMPWRMLPFPMVIGMLAHAARWALISFAGADVSTGALVASTFVGIVVTPIADRLNLPFAALGFSAVVSMMPGFFLFHAAGSLVELVSMGPRAPADMLTGIAANGVTAFLIILAMTVGLILPRILFEQLVVQHRRPS